MNCKENFPYKLSRFCTLVVNPVRNSRGALNPTGIILTFNPDSAAGPSSAPEERPLSEPEAGPEGAAVHYF